MASATQAYESAEQWISAMRNKTCIPNAPNLPSGPNYSGANTQILNATALENTQTGHKTPGQEDLGLPAQAQLQRNVGSLSPTRYC